METRVNNASFSTKTEGRGSRGKIRKYQTTGGASKGNFNKRKSQNQTHDHTKSSLKKKKRNPTKKVSNQIDFNTYKKIFSSTFSQFDSSNNINLHPTKNFQNFYSHVQKETEKEATINPTEEEKSCNMTNFLKTRKEGLSQTIEKTDKVFESVTSLLKKDQAFLDNFDMIKISNNVTDTKLKLEQCKKVVHKYNLNKEVYNQNSQKDEDNEQNTFSKRLKMYESIKQKSNRFSFDDINYEVEFVLKDANPGSVLGKRYRKESQSTNIFRVAKDFTDSLEERLAEFIPIEENLLDSLKNSQLDYLLKLNKKEEIDRFLKGLKMNSGSLNMENLDKFRSDERGLGWKIFKSLIEQNLDYQGGMSTRKGLDIVSTKERFRAQKKNADFLYYDSPMKKTISHDQEPRRRGHEKQPQNKKKGQNPPSQKAAPPSAHHSAEKMIIEEKADSEAPSSTVLKPMKFEFEELKAVQSVESVLESYRKTLEESFRKLKANDPNFVQQAILHVEEFDKKDSYQPIDNRNSGLNTHFNLGQDFESEYIPSLQTQFNDWGSQSKQIYNFPTSFSNEPTLPSFSTETQSRNNGNSNYLPVPMMVNSSPQIITPISIKPFDSGTSLPNTFNHSSQKSKTNGNEVFIPELLSSPQSTFQSTNYASDISPHGNNLRGYSETSLYKGQNPQERSLQYGRIDKGMDLNLGMSSGYLPGPYSKPNLGIEQLINQDEGINYFSIFNSMDQRKIPVPFMENSNEKPIKKNNIILTKTSFADS